MEISIIKNSMFRKSYKDMASMIDRPVDEISTIVSDLLANIDTEMETYQAKLTAKMASRPKKIRIRAKKVASNANIPALKKVDKAKLECEQKHAQKKANKLEKIRVENERQRTKRESRQQYKTIPVDYTEMRSIRIDSKTIIYAKPGEDIETVKNRFLKTYAKPIDKY